MTQSTKRILGEQESDELREDSEKWIDKHQAKVFVGVIVLGILSFGCAVLFAPCPLDYEKLNAVGFVLSASLLGLGSGIVMLMLIWSHEKSFWGKGSDSITFLLLGAAVMLVSSSIQLVKTFSEAMSPICS